MKALIITIVSLFALACATGPGGQDSGYLEGELGAAVERLKADVAANPTDEATVPERARVLADWVDAYSLAGGEVGLSGPRVLLDATLPPRGAAAVAAAQQIDRLVREFTLRDEEGALGELVAESLGPFEARTYATLRQTWTVGTHSVQTGGGFWVARHFNANYGRYQTEDASGAGYVTIETNDGDAVFEAEEIMASGPHGGFRAPQPALAFRLTEGELDPGETVTITYGDTSGGGPGLLMTGTSGARIPFPLYIDFDASGEWRPLPLLHFAVIGTEVAGVHGFAPTIVTPGESFELSVRAEDRYYNRATGDIPAFEVLVNGEVTATTPAGNEAITVLDMALEEEGVHWITLRSADGTITGFANPVLVVEDPEYRIFWGDTHGHSGYAEGIGTVDFFMRFARDDARLDYVTHSEHDLRLDDGEWEVMRRTSAEFDEPGRFVPFLGWEWSLAARWGGHHNVLYRTIGDQDRVSGLEYPSLSQLYQELHNRYDPNDVLVIPHAHNPGDYRQSDVKLETLVEMMSMHGSFEWFMQKYLSHGQQVGVVAASDDHLSHPGRSAPNRNSLAQRGGLGAVMAPEHSRDAIFDGLKQRRTYATTGDRMILDFKLNDIGMGQRAPFAETREIRGRVIGTAPIASIRVMKNDKAIWQQEYSSAERSGSGPTELLLSFYSEETPLHDGDAPRGWRHWRGDLTVTGARVDAISATDHVNPTTQSLERHESGARFTTNTRGEMSSLRLTLSNVQPGAAIVLDLEEASETGSAPPFYRERATIEGGQVRLRLADLRGGRFEHKMPIENYPDDSITLRRIVDGERDVEFSVTDSDEPRQGDYYYVHVRQLNDAMAWSSPVWVGGYPSQ